MSLGNARETLARSRAAFTITKSPTILTGLNKTLKFAVTNLEQQRMINLLPKDTVFLRPFENIVRACCRRPPSTCVTWRDNFPNGPADIQQIRHCRTRGRRAARTRRWSGSTAPSSPRSIAKTFMSWSAGSTTSSTRSTRWPSDSRFITSKDDAAVFIKQCDVLCQSTQAVSDAVLGFAKAASSPS